MTLKKVSSYKTHSKKSAGSASASPTMLLRARGGGPPASAPAVLLAQKDVRACHRVKVVIQYKGSSYRGWQSQPGGNTIQDIVESAIYQILRKRLRIVGSSRTDAGVHALCQLFHFDLDHKVDLGKLRHSLNSILPQDIVIADMEHVSERFHAQKSTKKKTYDYFIHNAKLRDPFNQDTAWHIKYPLDIKLMKKAAKYLIGEHDFRAFCASDTSANSTVRRVYSIKLSTPPHPDPLPKGRGLCHRTFLQVSITGNGFLKYMIRNIVGTLVDVGRGKTHPSDVKKILESKDRKKAGVTAPACGLFLKKITS